MAPETDGRLDADDAVDRRRTHDGPTGLGSDGERRQTVLALQGVAVEERTERVMALLDELGLKGMERRRPDHLSEGQQQRVAIARAIAAEPAVVLADEPTANVDSETAEHLLEIMRGLNEDRGVTFIFSTHDPKVVAFARRNVHLVDGRVASDERRAPEGSATSA